MSSSGHFIVSVDFPMYGIVSAVKKGSFNSSFPILFLMRKIVCIWNDQVIVADYGLSCRWHL